MKKNRLRFSNINLLRRTFLLLGCLLFSWSVVVPFYSIVSVSMEEGFLYSIVYWSFAEEARSSPSSHTLIVPGQRWFFDYWFGDSYISFLGLSWLPPAMFVTQIMTLATGTVSIFKAKRTVAAVSTAACLTTMLLMVYPNILLAVSYPLGYLATYLSLVLSSLVLFITNFLLILALPHQR